ncbi:hypothetical protein LC1981_0470 [Lacticaseibacillus paracasei NRIC 1981]|jgi:hypothetical protein|uniref:hypothetical protein n=1 Tax=Lacticaseibacillus paracasei TaxID=1597 RepID=UPI0005E9C91A|nr:hypothetical protein [Lacticaseibacillus paracasei]GAN41251.1 hypothetical protein LC1981_0470 [Lacticaseibacillus paracasei NRIC 1981]
MTVISDELFNVLGLALTYHSKAIDAREQFDLACDLDSEGAVNLESEWNDFVEKRDALLDDLAGRYHQGRLI